MQILKRVRKFNKLIVLLALLISVVGVSLAASTHKTVAACTSNGTYGVDTMSVNVATAGTYYIWTRMMPPSTSTNTVMLEVDGGNCYNVGGSSNLAANTWSWVNYQNGQPTTPITMSLTAGTHTFKYLSAQGAGIGVDNMLLLTDPSCIPTGTGSNCETVSTPTSISLSASTTTVTQGSPATLTAAVTSSNTITKVDFYDGFTLVGTDTSSPYTYTFNTSTSTTVGTHVFTAIATDSTGATTSSSAVNIQVNQAVTTTNVTVPFYLQAGGSGFKDSATGVTWQKDQYFTQDNSYNSTGGLTTGGDGSVCSTSLANSNCTTHAIAGTTDQQPYQTERWGDFHYDIPIANGNYMLLLKFAEINPNSGTRVFNVTANGTQVLSNFNIAAQVGNYTADDQSFPVSVSNGDLNVTFATVSNSAKVDGIEVLPVDSTPPTVSLTSPANNANVTGNATISANASDNVGVTKVVFNVDSNTVATFTGGPYSYTWNSTSVSNGSHTITATAYDAAGNKSSSTETVNVSNTDTTPPTTPTLTSATATAYNNVNLAWTASSDNVGVAGYYILRSTSGGAYTTIAYVGGSTLTYNDSSVGPSTTYSYEIEAFDAASNVSSPSSAKSATTPAKPDTSPPTQPTSLVATAVSSSQINLAWTASSDNVGVTAYKIYRNNSLLTTINAVSAPSYGDTNLTSSTTYSYYVVAYDAANNASTPSATVSATTQSSTTGNVYPTGTITGINGMCLDNHYSKKSNYNKIDIWSCNGTGAQSWTYNPNNGTIVNSNGYCLDVYANATTSGTLVDLYQCNGTTAQIWSVKGAPGKPGEIVSPHSGLCLDDQYSNKNNGNQVWVYNCNGTSAQEWTVN